jgi:alpha-tubulin suppressor-like RCC1 family protein
MGAAANIKYLQMADGFGCYLTAGNGVQCWGNNTFGELGNGTTTQSATPVPVNGLGSGVTWLSANGSTAACAVVSGGRLQCWGRGVLGSDASTPTDVPGLTSGVVSVSVGGEDSSCVIMTDGSVQCWEAGSPPAPVPGVSSAVYVATNEGCSCALLSDGKIMCWGSCPGSTLDADASDLGFSSPATEVPGF